VGIVDDQDAPPGEARVVFAAEPLDAVDRSVIAAHAEDAVGDYQRALRLPERLLEALLECAQVEVPVDLARLVGSELHPVDDAIVVQLVGDQHRLLRGEAEEDARHRRIGGPGDHRRRAGVEFRQRAFQLHVRLVGAADEPDCSRPDAVRFRGLLLRLDQLAAQGEAQIRVRVHADELAVVESSQEEARPSAVLGRLHRHHHVFLGLGGAGSFQVRELRLQILEQLL
jgi:hypothetical protein